MNEATLYELLEMCVFWESTNIFLKLDRETPNHNDLIAVSLIGHKSELQAASWPSKCHLNSDYSKTYDKVVIMLAMYIYCLLLLWI